MQLGTRWAAGSPAPARLGDDLRERIAQAEAALTEDERAGWRWTLTWLEGRPIVESDSGLVIR